MKKLWMMIGVGVLLGCVAYTGFDIALHTGEYSREDFACHRVDPEEDAARDLMIGEVDLHLRYLTRARNAIARRYGWQER